LYSIHASAQLIQSGGEYLTTIGVSLFKRFSISDFFISGNFLGRNKATKATKPQAIRKYFHGNQLKFKKPNKEFQFSQTYQIKLACLS
jgi:hypothetical protein